MSELDQLRALVAVINHGGLTRAAMALGISKSMMSRRIAHLEAELGTRLLTRTSRGVGPTEAGLQLKLQGERILTQLAEARDAVARHQGEVTGRLRLALPLAFGIRYITPLLARLCQEHPGLEIDASYSDRHIDLLGEGFDAAIRLGTLKDSTLLSRRISTIPILVVASPSYVAEHGAPKTPTDLSDRECLIYTARRERLPWEFRAGRRRISVTPNGRFHADNGEALVQLAEAGLGILAAPLHLVADGLSAGRLVPLLSSFQIKERGFYIVRPPGAYIAAKVRALIELVERSFAVPPWAQIPSSSKADQSPDIT